MISHANKCVFVHIPKSAGTSVIATLKDANDYENYKALRQNFRPDDNKFTPPPPHLRAYDHVTYGLIDEQAFNSYFKFAFVRNPWDRIVSEYKYRRHPGMRSFKKFLFKAFPIPSWTDEYCHVIPQYDFLYSEDGKLLVDFVGKFENIDEGYAHIRKQLGLPPKKLPHKNRSLSLFRRDNNLYQILKTIKDAMSIEQKRNTFKHYTEYYDAETIEFVEQLYIRDVETFNYSFGD